MRISDWSSDVCSSELRNLASQLSGGEQQMLAIGRALMTNPRLLVLDEATEGLAPLIRQEIWRALGELTANGLSQIDRKRVVSGKSVSVRVNICGPRVIKKKKKRIN